MIEQDNMYMARAFELARKGVLPHHLIQMSGV